MKIEITGIKARIEKAGSGKVQNLACCINVELLRSIHQKMDGKKAVGIDGITKQAYSENLEGNLTRLVEKMKNGSYMPKPSRRVYIDKPGSDKKRPLGISSYEDKLVENAVGAILSAVYEEKFCDSSYGFRPGRSAHQALREIAKDIQEHKVSYVVEADIQSFFDTLSHEWEIRFLEHDIADGKFIELIRRMLKAGVMENGVYYENGKGSPQGNGASPVLANVYLHYVLDFWFEKYVKKYGLGEAYIARFADDFVTCFQYKSDAERYYKELPERFGKFSLSLSAEKTKIIEFGRFAQQNREKKHAGKPETFNFLGLTFYCGKSLEAGKFLVKVKSDRKKVATKLKKLNLWLKENRHMPVKELIGKLNQSLVGYYNYYAVTCNAKNLRLFRDLAMKMLFKWLNRRSQKSSYNWDQFQRRVLSRFPLAVPKSYFDLLMA